MRRVDAQPYEVRSPAARPHELADWLERHEEELVAFRRNLHAHPELSGAEHATTDLVAERLQLAGLEPRVLAVGTGLVCDIADADDPRPRYAIRADLDALAMADEKDVPYRSQVPGVSHACGHDVHTTIALGAALYFAHEPERRPGPLRFVFQPAEERVPGGALDVLTDGALDGVEAIVGLHCEPKLEVGQIGIRSGPISSAADMATITLSGPGGHTARPEMTTDLITIAARTVAMLPTAVAELVAPCVPAEHEAGMPWVKVVFGAFHAGDAANVIPSSCLLRASVRTPYLDVWDALPAAFADALEELLVDTGAGHDLDYIHGVPPVLNHPAVSESVHRAACAEFGTDAVVAAVQSWGGDDFAWFTREVPGTYVRLGTHDPDDHEPRLDLHAGHFDVDERAIGIGIRLLVRSANEHFAHGLDTSRR